MVNRHINLAILDSCAGDLIQPGGMLEYLTTIDSLEISPSRKAREESNLAKQEISWPQSTEKDAPVPMVTNNLRRKTNDPAVVIGPTKGMLEVVKMKSGVYSNNASETHIPDREVIGSAVDLCEKRIHDGWRGTAYFISADRTCCIKANQHFLERNIPIKVLHARKQESRIAEGVSEVFGVFPP